MEERKWIELHPAPTHGLDWTSAGKIWGEAHGYWSERGGWIFHKGREKPVCQGWPKLYKLCKKAADEWLNERYSEGRKKKKA